MTGKFAIVDLDSGKHIIVGRATRITIEPNAQIVEVDAIPRICAMDLPRFSPPTTVTVEFDRVDGICLPNAVPVVSEAHGAKSLECGDAQ